MLGFAAEWYFISRPVALMRDIFGALEMTWGGHRRRGVLLQALGAALTAQRVLLSLLRGEWRLDGMAAGRRVFPVAWNVSADGCSPPCALPFLSERWLSRCSQDLERLFF